MEATGRAGDQATVRGHGIELTGLARGQFSTGPVTVAIRPEDFAVAVEPPDPQNHIRVGIEVVEYHGREQAIQARLPEGEPLKLRSSNKVARGDVVSVWVRRDHVLVFGEQLDGPPVEVAAGPSAGVATNDSAPTKAGAPS
jgi:putative spermidine/putrescine transport system ATP-binding protein